MRTNDDIKKECFDGLIQELKSKPDSEYPVRIAYDCSIATKEEIFKKSNLYAITRESNLRAKEVFLEESMPGLREIIIDRQIKLGDNIIPKNSIMPFYGNNLIEKASEVNIDQFIVGTIMAITEIVPEMGEDKEAYRKDMINLLKAYGPRAKEILSKSDNFKSILEEVKA